MVLKLLAFLAIIALALSNLIQIGRQVSVFESSIPIINQSLPASSLKLASVLTFSLKEMIPKIQAYQDREWSAITLLNPRYQVLADYSSI